MIIENSIDITGALKSVTRTAYDLKDFYEFTFVLPRKSKGRFWIEEKGFTSIVELPMKEISRRFSSIVLYVPLLLMNTIRLRRLLKKEKIDLIHVNDLYNLLPPMLWLLGCKIPYVCHVRFLPNRFPPSLFNFWLHTHLRYANRLIAVSKSVLEMLPNSPKIELIHNELPIEERYPQRLQINDQKETYIFLYLSNFMKGKGQDFALQAFAKIHDQLPAWKIRFVGGDMGLIKNKNYREHLMEKAQALGIFDKTEWKGFTEDVESEYKQADVVLNFSESESFSITCLEALFFGMPLIATDCGGPAEIIDHNHSGILVPNKDVNAMSREMLRLALNNERRDIMGAVARTSVREKFSIEKTSFRLKEVYDQVYNT